MAKPPEKARQRDSRAARIEARLKRCLRQWKHGLVGWKWFQGDYLTWADARAAAGGYDDPKIVERVLTATLAVRNGEAAFERDSVLFYEPADDEPLLAALKKASAQNRDRLRVLDFGGSLGTVYWRHRAWLKTVTDHWDIVEQPGFVAAGRQHFSDTPLRFFPSVETAEGCSDHDVLLCSTALQYLPDPHAVLDRWKAFQGRFLLFNNLPLHRKKPDRLRIQHIPPEIYTATYPCWFFNRDRFLEHFSKTHEVLAEFASEAVWPVGFGSYPSTGLLLGRMEVR